MTNHSSTLPFHKEAWGKKPIGWSGWFNLAARLQGSLVGGAGVRWHEREWGTALDGDRGGAAQ